MRPYIVIAILFYCMVHQAPAQIAIENVKIYNHFPERGFTTAGLSTELKELKEKRADLISLPFEHAKAFEKIMKNAKIKKHGQTKTGIVACFGKIETRSKIMDVVIFNGLIHRHDTPCQLLDKGR